MIALLAIAGLVPAALAADPSPWGEAPPPAPASPATAASLDTAEEADVQFTLGVAAYRKGDYLGAVEHYLASNRLVPNRNVVYNLAKAYEQLGRYDAAWRQYDQYVQVEPDAALRAEGVAARARLASRVALVRVESDPPGCLIFVDREDLGARGQTPASIALPAGPHAVFARCVGHHDSPGLPVTAVVGSEATVRVAPAPILGEVVLTGPEGATLVAPYEAALPARLSLPPGRYTFTVRAAGHRDATVPVDVAAEETVTRAVELPWVTGTVVVEAPERGARIDVDGVPGGFTPAVLSDVRVGRHHLDVRADGFRPYGIDIDVLPDGTLTVNAQLVSLNEVTAASRSAKAVQDAPASVSLVSAEEIRAFGDTTVWQVLANQRGFYGTSDRTYDYVGVRGFGRSGDYNNRLLLTLDGHTLNDDQLGASYLGHDGGIDLYDLERIEVVRGAGSVLYGSNAFLGVVNLVSRTGDRTRPTHVVIGAESDRTARARAGTRVRLGKGTGADAAWLSVSAGGLLSQGQDFTFPDLATDANPLGASVGADGATAAGGTARLQAGDWTVVGWMNTRDKRIPTGAYETILADPRAHSADTRGFAEVRWEPTVSRALRLATRAYVDRYDFEGAYPYADPDDVVRDTWHGTWGGAEARAVVNPLTGLEFTAGAEARLHVQADLRGSDSGGVYLDESVPFQVYGAYLLTEINPAAAVSLAGGARVDAYSSFGTSANPRLAVIVRPGRSDTVKLLGGGAFRAPSPYELHYNDDGVTQLAAPDLGPEHTWSGELEYTRRLGDVSTLTISTFAHRIDNLIGIAFYGDDSGGALRYTNSLEPVHAVGAEGELRREWRGGWLAAASVSAQRTREGDLFTGAELENSPAVTASARGAAPVVAGITLASRVRLESSRLSHDGSRTEPAIGWDVNATGAFVSHDAHAVSWSLGVRNLLDWNIEYPASDELTQSTVPGPPRSVTAELGWSW